LQRTGQSRTRWIVSWRVLTAGLATPTTAAAAAAAELMTTLTTMLGCGQSRVIIHCSI